MKTLTLAITSDCVDNIAVLPPVIHFADQNTQVLVHRDALVELDDNEPVCNFDLHIAFTTYAVTDAQTLYPDRYVHMHRNSKTSQALELARLVKANKLDIQIPAIYRSTNRNVLSVAISHYGVPKGDVVVVKRENGARGCGQALVPVNQLNDFLSRGGEPFNELEKAFPDVHFTPMYSSDGVVTDEMKNQGYFQNDTVYVSEYVDNIVAEYRVLVGGTTIRCRGREISGDAYKQANMDVSRPVSGGSPAYVELETLLSPKMAADIKALIDVMNFRYGSIDLYVTEDGQLGIFEYCHQFGFKATDPNFIRELSVQFVRHVLEQRGMLPPSAPLNAKADSKIKTNIPLPAEIIDVLASKERDLFLADLKKIIDRGLFGEYGGPQTTTAVTAIKHGEFPHNTVHVLNVCVRVFEIAIQSDTTMGITWAPCGRWGDAVKALDVETVKLVPRLSTETPCRLIAIDLYPA